MITKIKFCLTTFFLVSIILYPCSLIKAQNLGNFKLGESFTFSGQPDFTQYGLSSFYTTGGEFWAGIYPNYDYTHPDETVCRALADKLHGTGKTLVIDIEDWSDDTAMQSNGVPATPDTVRESVTKFLQIINWVRSEAPDVKVGIYSFPLSYYWPLINGSPDPAKLAIYQAANDLLKPAMDASDYVFPSLYAGNPNRKAWAEQADIQIREANRLEPGKVLPFLWMNYNEPGYPLMNSGDLKFDLDTLKQYYNQGLVSGAVIWGGFDVVVDKALPWNANAGWWQEVLTFTNQGNQNSICGDGYCSASEGCLSCPADCGACQITPVNPNTITDSFKSGPTNLVAIIDSGNHVHLSWNPPPDSLAVAGYNVYRCNSSANCFPSEIISTTSTASYVDTGILIGSRYNYAVAAYNSSGNISPTSQVAYALTNTAANTSNVFTKSLYLRVRDEQVSALQTLLAKDSQIYPEAKITGYYWLLTYNAVGRFQIKYNIVSGPYSPGYGLVGPKTRQVLNQLNQSSR